MNINEVSLNKDIELAVKKTNEMLHNPWKNLPIINTEVWTQVLTNQRLILEALSVQLTKSQP